MILRRLRCAPLVLALMLGLAGCGSPEQPAASPTPIIASPPPVSTPSPTPDMDALYAEAERVLRRWAEIETDYMKRADYSQFPPAFYEVLEEPILGLSQTHFQTNKDNGWRGIPGTDATLTVQPAPGIQVEGSEVALRVCADTTDTPLVDADGEVVSPGGITVKLYYFKHFDGKLKIFWANPAELVTECPFD